MGLNKQSLFCLGAHGNVPKILPLGGLKCTQNGPRRLTVSGVSWYISHVGMYVFFEL